jgi:hypothetical protein
MTLPLIHVLNTCTAKEKWLINSIKNHNKDKKESKKLLHLSKTTTVYSTPRQNWISARSITLLDIYPQSDFKDALILMVNYVIERKNNSILSFWRGKNLSYRFLIIFTTACNLLCLESSIVIETPLQQLWK